MVWDSGLDHVSLEFFVLGLGFENIPSLNVAAESCLVFFAVESGFSAGVLEGIAAS